LSTKPPFTTLSLLPRPKPFRNLVESFKSRGKLAAKDRKEMPGRRSSSARGLSTCPLRISIAS
jgi:hypothetical protein